VLLVLLLSACATSTGGGPGGKDQGDAATAAWRAAYDSRDPARITAMYDSDAVLWGTTAKTVAPNPSAIAEYFKDAGKRPNARVSFGEQHLRVYGDVAVSTGYYTFSDVQRWQGGIASCALYDGVPKSGRKMAHRGSPFIARTITIFRGVLLPSNNAFEDGRSQTSLRRCQKGGINGRGRDQWQQ